MHTHNTATFNYSTRTCIYKQNTLTKQSAISDFVPAWLRTRVITTVKNRVKACKHEKEIYQLD